MSIGKLFGKRNLPVLVFAVSGLLILFSHFTGLFTKGVSELITWPVTIANFAAILGAFHLIVYHGKKVSEQKEGWSYSTITLVCMVITFGASFVSQPLFDWINTNVVATLSTVMTSFVGLFMYVLFYRAARVRNLEISLLILSTIFVFFYMAPIGDAINPTLTVIGKWINDVPNKGAMRGTLICIAVGMIGLFLRSLVGLERAHLGGE